MISSSRAPAPQTSRLTAKGERTYRHILGSARRVFGRVGYVATTMSDVAKESGLSLGGLYRYFNNKEDLFAQVIKDLKDELFAASRAPSHSFRSDPYGAILEANVGFFRHYWDNRDVMRSYIEASTVVPRFRESIWSMRQRHTDRFVAVMRAQHPSRIANDLDLELAAEAMMCLVEQAAYVWYAHESIREKQNQRTVTPEEAARTVTAACVGMFVNAPSALTTSPEASGKA